MEHARDYDAYARRKRNVFSLDLNVTNDKLFLMSIGIVFHSFGAATEKARLARTVRVRGRQMIGVLSAVRIRRVDCLSIPVGGGFWFCILWLRV